MAKTLLVAICIVVFGAMIIKGFELLETQITKEQMGYVWLGIVSFVALFAIAKNLKKE